MSTGKITFFIIDDDPDDIMLFREVLSDINEAIDCISATNGREALNMLNAESVKDPSLIFLDLNMPKMDGRECLKELKSNPQLKHIPVIIYTTSSLHKDREETRQLGAHGFISKPSSLRELNSILDRISTSLPDNLNNVLDSINTRPDLLGVN